MSHIDDLMRSLCPNGVKYRELSEIAEIRTGSRPTDVDLKTGGPCAYMNGGVVESGRVPDSNTPGDIITIPSRGSVGVVGYQRQPFWCGPLCYRISSRETNISNRFIYFYMKSIQDAIINLQQTGSIPALNKKQVASVRIPIPPVEIQQEIVRILSSFVELETELETEVEGRRIQYAYYRRSLIEQSAATGGSLPLGSIGRVVTGRTPKVSNTSLWGGDLDFVTPSDISGSQKYVSAPARTLSNLGRRSTKSCVIPARSILVTCIGADMGKCIVSAHECVTNQQINSIILNDNIDVDYCFHVLSSMRAQLRMQGERGGSTLPIINKTDFSKIEIPVPPLQEQHRIASTLDAFHSLSNDLVDGLPAEIQARRQQYEYYRDKLLTFEELPA